MLFDIHMNSSINAGVQTRPREDNACFLSDVKLDPVQPKFISEKYRDYYSLNSSINGVQTRPREDGWRQTRDTSVRRATAY